MKFSIRDLLWLTVVVALALGWWLEHWRLSRQLYMQDAIERERGVLVPKNWHELPATLKTPADGDPASAGGEFLGASSSEQAAVSLNSSRVITFPSRIGKVEAEYQHHVEVTQLSPYSIEVTGHRTGAAEFIVWLENGKKTTIQISVAEE